MSNRKNILLAPNGKPSNLNEEQYYLVRTPEFKQWFGDWEKLAMAKVKDSAMDEVTLANLSKDVSKVVDENGEPLICFHGTNSEFTIFKIKPRVDSIENEYYESGMWFFAPSFDKNLSDEERKYFYKKGNAEFMASNFMDNKDEIGNYVENKVLKVFLNVRNPKVIGVTEFQAENLKHYSQKMRNDKKNDAVILHGSVTDGNVFRDDINILNPEQIKLADGTNTTFDGSNPDIRFDGGGQVNSNSFMKWYIDWYKGISDKMNIVFSLPNAIQPFKEKNAVILDLFEKKDQTINAKPYLKKIVEKANEYDVVIYLEPKPRHKYFQDNSQKKNKITREYLIDYYEKFGFQLTPNKQFMKRLPHFADGGLIAPNGKKSNLTAEQYKLVRTKAFKDWFGDWENDPANASKVVDDNGEPLLVFHGSSDDFNVFEIRDRKIGRRQTSTRGFYFTKNKWVASQYAGSDGFVKSYFIKILNYPTKKDKIVLKYDNIDDYLFDYGKTIEKFGYDGAIDNNGDFIVWSSNQIKLADGSNTTFDGSNPDIRFDGGGKLFNNGGNMKNIGHGGITYGESHANGGIKVQNKSTGEMLEVEGGEGVVNKRSMASDKMIKLNGKQMSICEAVSKLNEMEGGVKFSCDDVKHKQFIEEMEFGGELERGIRTEKEHIATLIDIYNRKYTPEQATEMIAKDHLEEDPYYYSKLATIENTSSYNPMVYLDKEEDEITQMIKEQQRKKFERELIMARGGMASCGCSHHKKYDDGGKTDCGCSDYVKSLPRPKLENGAFIDFSGKDLPKFTGDVTNKPTSIGGLIDIKGQAEANKPNEREERNAERFKMVLSRAEELLNKDYLPVLKDSQQTKYLNKYFEPYNALNLYKLGWRFTINTDAESVGLCEYNRAKEKNKQKRNLYLSYRYIIGDDNFINEMDSVILHEISHAIVAELFFLNEFELDTTQIREVDLKGVVAQVNKFDLIDPQHEVTKGHGVTWANVCIALTGGYICRMFYEYAIQNEQINPFMYKCIKCGTEDFGDNRSFAKVCKKCSTPVLIVKHFK